MQPALQSVDGDAEPLGSFGCAQLPDIPQQDDFALKWIELGERASKELDPLAERDRVFWINDLEESFVAALRRLRRPAMTLEQAKALAARFLPETVAFWAVHRHWDPSPQQVVESDVKANVIELLVRSFEKE